MNILKNKELKQLLIESENGKCCSMKTNDELLTKCESLKRIEIVLDAYHQLIHYIDKSKWNNISISNMIQIEGKYEHQQLFNDFCHIKIIHIDNDNVHI